MGLFQMSNTLLNRASIYASTINRDSNYNCYIDSIIEDDDGSKIITIKMYRSGLYMGTIKVLSDCKAHDKKSIKELANNLHNIIEHDSYSSIHFTIRL